MSSGLVLVVALGVLVACITAASGDCERDAHDCRPRRLKNMVMEVLRQIVNRDIAKDVSEVPQCFLCAVNLTVKIARII